MKFKFTFQAATHPTKVSLRVYIKNKWNICSGLLVHVSLSRRYPTTRPGLPGWKVFLLEWNSYSYSRTLVRAPKPCRHTGWLDRRFSKEKPWCWGDELSGFRNGPGAEPQIYPPLNFPAFLYVCYSMNLSVLALWHVLKNKKAVELPLKSTCRGWHAFPRKKKKSYRKETLQPRHPHSLLHLAHRHCDKREYTCRYQSGWKLQKIPTWEAVSFMQHHLPALFEHTHCFGISRIWN